MLELIRGKPFLVAILGGACAQFLKVLSFLIVEKRVNYRRFVQTDGLPNMHAATFSALSVAVGMTEGFDSLPFALALCLTSIIVVDTMNVKVATSRQAEVLWVLMDRVRKSKGMPPSRLHGMSYTRVDVITGLAVGTALALLIL